MPIFPLDSVRNAVPQGALEVVLEAVREELATFPFSEDVHGGNVADVLQAFDASRPRLNVIASMLSDINGQVGADISVGLGFLPVLLRRRGLNVIMTEHDPSISHFAVIVGPVLPYTIGVSAPPIATTSLDFLVCSEVLEHLNLAPVRAMTELASLLKDGGLFVLTTPNVARLAHIELLAAGENFLETFGEGFPTDQPATDFVEHVREYSIREVVEAIEGAGLRIDELVMTGWGDNGYSPHPNPYANELIVVRATK